MFSVFHGSDTFESRKKLQKAMQRLGDDVSLLRFDEISFSKEALEDALGAQGLFGGKTVVVLDSVLENENAGEEVLGFLREMQQSPNQFYLLAGGVTAKTEKELAKHAASIEKSDLSEGKQKQEFNVFQLADAFVRRDKKSAWVLFTKARMRDMEPQGICGTLMWQMRMLVLAYTTESAKEAGVSDFPYRKAKASMKYFSKVEAEDMLSRLLAMYHFDPKENRGDLAVALERLILGL